MVCSAGVAAQTVVGRQAEQLRGPSSCRMAHTAARKVSVEVILLPNSFARPYRSQFVHDFAQDYEREQQDNPDDLLAAQFSMHVVFSPVKMICSILRRICAVTNSKYRLLVSFLTCQTESNCFGSFLTLFCGQAACSPRKSSATCKIHVKG
jgi:hypothetical protein